MLANPGIDYVETFSPVIRFGSLRLLLALAVIRNMDVDQMDVMTAFLNPSLEEEIYMELPNDEILQGRICRLKKSIYGLKQASRAWNHEIDRTLKNLDFKQSKYDPCIYHRFYGKAILYIALYVDDFIIVSNNVKEKQWLKKRLMERFKMKDLGSVHHCLGIRIIRDRKMGYYLVGSDKIHRKYFAKI